ncbi:Uncharacterized protein BP5553_09210 [Venustampulla echinocandica]|uniref:1-alkyl-2-acetylglycerophosphocholine esterase n=1 Tax=Venustampulla echinocandica TaxID=2656787 RepID=A0A370TC34_9HELO|nr:Uncharacterized protein BP5553_09210 [Venustampulla echinocandica]RDL31808.1 Uncharacterized protein BP5553_09210 [Venustampulla echinocandica]
MLPPATLTQRLLALLSILSSVSATTILPKPPGPFDVYYNTAKMVDPGRIDPFDPKKGHRAVMTSIFLPVRCPTSLKPIAYLPPKTGELESELFGVYGLPNGTLQSLNLQVCPGPLRTRLQEAEQHPVVIFSPALNTPRHFYSLIAQAVASYGYIVVSIDHPYDADIVEFPDGSAVYAINFTDEQIPVDVDTRAGDVSFVLNQLSCPGSVKDLLPGSKGLKTHKVAMFGHSVGGAAAAQAMLRDKRIVGGVNLDGSFISTVVQKGLDRPFLIFGHENKTQATDDSWAETWSHLRSWKLELGLAKSQHYTFSDLPALLNLLHAPQVILDAAAERVGTLDGLKALDIVQTYVVAFLDFVLLNKKPEVLQHVVAEFPEVSFIDK